MRLHISSPLPGQLFYIDETGRMPALRFEAGLLDGNQQLLKTPLQWVLQIAENVWPGACPNAKIGRQVINLQGMSMGLGNWIPSFNAICGGDATLSVSADYLGEVYRATVNFRIRGKNPSPEAVLDRLGGENSAMARLGRYLSGLKQFDMQGMPYLGENGEVGIMQLCDLGARQPQRWSWVHNIDTAKAMMQRLQGSAKAYLDQHRFGGSYPNNQSLSDAGVLLREMLQRFLVGAYWQWGEQELQWRRNPPDNTVDELLRRDD